MAFKIVLLGQTQLVFKGPRTNVLGHAQEPFVKVNEGKQLKQTWFCSQNWQ